MESPRPAGAPIWRDAAPVVALGAAVLVLIAGAVTALVTAPEVDDAALLASAEALADRGEPREALDLLNGAILARLDSGQLAEDEARRFHLLRARAVYLAQQEAGLDLEANHRNIVAEYGLAGPEEDLGPRDRYYLADTYVSLGRLDAALRVARLFPPEEHERRTALVRRAVERRLEGAASTDAAAMLDELALDGTLPPDLRAWVVARRAEGLIRAGRLAEAVERVLRGAPRLDGADPAAMGELFVLLGRAYLELGDVAQAAAQAERALAMLPEEDPRHGRALVLRARVDEAFGEANEARLHFARAAERYGDASVRPEALLGLGESHAVLGDLESSLEAYDALVAEMPAGGTPDLPPGEVIRSLLRWHAENLEAGRPEVALRYALLAERLGGQEAPDGVLLAIARAHRLLADGMLADGPPGVDRALALAALPSDVRASARTHLKAAGAYFRRHAERVAATDAAAYSDSLWAAAESLDLAGEATAAAEVWTRYIADFANDPRQAEARFRLAQLQQARGDYAAAAELYRGLIESAVADKGVGPYAEASYVPLAQAYLADESAENDAEAERLLEYVVEGNLGGTAMPAYREALWVLAKARHRAGDHAAAVQRLEEWLARAAEDPRRDAVRYDLAEACRLEAESIRTTLGGAMPDADRRRLEALRRARLERAAELYGQVRDALDGRDPATLSALERLQLRNSWFYLGDCAFDLGRFEAARRLYDAARERYPDDPASLVAMIQIVNAYLEEGDLARAATANERARRFYASLPDEAWDDPQLPIGREDWQRWLDSIAALMPAPEPVRSASAEEDLP